MRRCVRPVEGLGSGRRNGKARRMEEMVGGVEIGIQIAKEIQEEIEEKK